MAPLSTQLCRVRRVVRVPDSNPVEDAALLTAARLAVATATNWLRCKNGVNASCAGWILPLFLVVTASVDEDEG